ncbi:MAG TPA: glycoside hydrolase family 3 C-terminal domain-containing protein, partial [Candidatus Didemnitutus sp.]|nr:glycoside hydrolase family 3 C-terminal domain-containing protein [Candidatus Didemnitutus sp.]
ISEAEIDTSVRRLLSTKFKLGFFDAPEKVPYTSISVDVIDCPEHRKLARQAAAESIVLLKNKDNVLPLAAAPAGMLVVGPNAANINALLGNYYGINPRMVTFMEGLVERTPEGCRVKYRMGCPLSQKGAPGVNYTFGAADMSEVVIAVLGLDPSLEGEEGDTVASPVGGDRPTIELPENQRNFLRELRQHSKKLILVLTGGSAISIPEEHEYCDAILQVWYPGCEGGRALADILFGDVSPSGKLPLTVPKQTSDLPAFNDYSMKGRTYRFAEKEPLYPFGFGLSYAQLKYGPLHLSSAELAEKDEVVVRTTLTSRSPRPVSETVQCYLVPPTRPDAPKAALVDFKKVTVPAAGTVEVEFTLPSAAFRQVDANGKLVWTPGACKLVVGSASPGPRAQALGAPAPATAELRLR